MKLSRFAWALCFAAACASYARAQEGGGQQSPAPVGESAPRVLQPRASRAAVVRLKNGESIACHFLSADDDHIEVEAAGKLRQFALDAVAGIDFAPRPAEGKTQAAARGAAAAHAPLVVTARRCEMFDRFTAFDGEVRNNSPRTINNLLAVGTFRSKNGAVLQVERRLLGNIPPGHTASFKLWWWYDPRVNSCTVSFRIHGGPPVAHTEELGQ